MSTKLCIAGKNQISVDVLAAARTLPDVEIVCLPTMVDRGYEGWQPSLFAAAERAGVPIVRIEDLYGEKNLVFLSVEYDRIIKPYLFYSSTRLYNLHFSLLPKYRGCNTSIWPILNGEDKHGVTLHVIDSGVDTGDVIAQSMFEIGAKTARDLYFECMNIGAQLCIQYMPKMIAGNIESRPQNLEQGSLYKRSDLDFSRKNIDFSQTTEDVLRQIRAFTFPEYQLPLAEGRAILTARQVSDDETSVPQKNVLRYATADGMVELRVTDTPPAPIALQQSGY